MRSFVTCSVAALALLLAPAAAQAKWHSAAPLPPRWPTITHAGCPGVPDAAGCVIDWIGPECQDANGCVWLSNDHGRYDRMHELGHVFDHQVLTDVDRQRFTRMMGLGDRPWVVLSTQPDGLVRDDGDSPNESFADAYAMCTMGIDGRGGGARYQLAPYYFAPTPRQYDQLCAAIRFVALS